MKKRERRKKIVVVQEETLESVQGQGDSGYSNPGGHNGPQDPPPDGGG
jgi:hypothetical protein